MPDYDNNLTGALFKNAAKATEKHPDYKGSATIGEQEYWVSVWIKTSKAGEKFMSLAFTEKDGAKVGKNQTGKVHVPDDITNDVPF
jgi:uncharacterized protein (DUF736 family)